MHSLRKKLDYDYLKNDIADLLSESRDGLARVRKIVQDLKSLSHVSGSVWEWADIHHGLDSTLNMVWNELKYHCTASVAWRRMRSAAGIVHRRSRSWYGWSANGPRARRARRR